MSVQWITEGGAMRPALQQGQAGAVGVASGTTAERPTTPASGDTRYNETTGKLEWHDGSGWKTIDDESAYAAAGHTHTASEVSDFDTEVANNSAVSANTAKVTNATHTGDVTGSTALTIANNAVTYAKMQDVSATDKLLGRATAGAGDVEEIACTAAGRALIDDANAAAQRTTLGLGSAATVTLGTDWSTTLAANLGSDWTIAFASALASGWTTAFFTSINSSVVSAFPNNTNSANGLVKLDGTAVLPSINIGTPSGGNLANCTGAVLNTLVDAKGDIICATADNTPARLAVGTDDDMLVADSTQPTGLKWSGEHSGKEVAFSQVDTEEGCTAVYVDLTTPQHLSFTLAEAKTVIVVGMAVVRNTATASTAALAADVDGADYPLAGIEIAGNGYRNSICGSKAFSLGAGSHTIKLQFASTAGTNLYSYRSIRVTIK